MIVMIINVIHIKDNDDKDDDDKDDAVAVLALVEVANEDEGPLWLPFVILWTPRVCATVRARQCVGMCVCGCV